jgi:hypothetical protein
MDVLRALVALLFLLVALPVAAAPTPGTPVAKPNADEVDEGLFEDVLPQYQIGKPKVTEWLVTVDAKITVAYTFSSGSAETFNVTYHITLGGPVAGIPATQQGIAKIKTEINGYLAKWTSGQCLLQVSIADAPYELILAGDGDKRATIKLLFKQKIFEDWQSLCTFIDAPDSRFYTKGEPEKWIAEALQKAEPSLDKLGITTSDKDKTETKFKIAKYTVKDGNIGNATVEGSGTVTLQPPVQPVVNNQ